jgi:adenosylcobinamide-GDP ribazoletransferase
MFLTRLPMGWLKYSDSDWRLAAAHFPLVGAMIGAATGLVYTLLLPIGTHAAALLAVGFSMVLTGCFHEDGLADSADALGGGYTRERVLEILKDSRIGSFGAAALVVSIGARALLLANLEGTVAPWAMAFVGCAARLGPVWQMVLMPYATDQGSKSRDLTRGGVSNGLIATGWFLILSLVLVSPAGLSIVGWLWLMALLVLVTCALGFYWYRRVQGVTGDFLGATEQVSEVLILSVLCWGIVR